jgi:hypothetical protein
MSEQNGHVSLSERGYANIKIGESEQRWDVWDADQRISDLQVESGWLGSPAPVGAARKFYELLKKEMLASYGDVSTAMAYQFVATIRKRAKEIQDFFDGPAAPKPESPASIAASTPSG